ncbi:hypothetical protein [Morganella psychrotolerans]|uniref:Four-helix bundle copper-binding protein n=1 Tax=Morganella psychrotolerans TaxID=368603 RepID=A0A1B8H0C0_9GAMM|nr:hypothetical protein [Morganella psychrotolerans]OBU02514.1 hypothetical protein AYY17_12745 [Morganella psychrotolerans]
MKNINECVAVFNDCVSHCRQSLVRCLKEGHGDNTQCHLAMLHCAEAAQFAAMAVSSAAPYTKAACEICMKACRDCIDVCKSEGGHAECIGCCQACIDMCHEMIKTDCCSN